MVGATWDTRLGFVAGKKAAKELAEHLDLHTVGQLLSYYPRRYLELDKVSALGDLVEGELVTLVARIGSTKVHSYPNKKTGRPNWRTEIEAKLGDDRIWMTFFDQRPGAAERRVGKHFRRGTSVLLSGRFGRNRFRQHRWELTHPEVSAPEDDPAQLIPVYRLAGPVRNDLLRRVVRLALDVMGDVPDALPERLREEHGLIGIEQALRWIHRPQDRRQAGAAQKRLKYDEAFVAQVVLAQRRQEQRAVRAVPRDGRPGGILDAFDARMPFALTAGQRRVEEEILADLAGSSPMRRLLQGEVGSGKTVVALRAMLRVVDSGGQAALLAPTEVLAQQHHRSITAMLGNLAEAGRLGAAEEATRVALLTGSLSAARRREALLEVASGTAGIVVGTHALLEESVQFADLAMVVVDEQHRFGVVQRATLAARSTDRHPHELVMTATPIPRTVAMTVFGDLETSALTELPAGRSAVQTTVVPLREAPAWFDRVWQRVREEVERGHQVYVVCPRIEGDQEDDVDGGWDDATDEGRDDGGDLGGDFGGDAPTPSLMETVLDDRGQKSAGIGTAAHRPLASVETVARALEEGPLAGLRIARLHGRLPADLKEQTMLAFAAGEVDVLVATTVIEVGVDVANATMMVLLDADRFGVSQLHQMRGRVGRGGHPGLCLLVTSAAPGSGARQRLDAVASTTDGFKLAELDLELRREGNVLGNEQSGSHRQDLRVLSVIRDGDIIERARAMAVDLVARDPDLTEEPELRVAVEELHARTATDYLDKA